MSSPARRGVRPARRCRGTHPFIDEAERSAIFGSLRAGVAPAVGLRHLQVGRRAEMAAIERDLERVAHGAAAVRFVVGRYGAGKTFFMGLVAAAAMERGFAVARADFTRDRHLAGAGGVARALYGELVRNLATDRHPRGGALPGLVEGWLDGVARETLKHGGGDADIAGRVAAELTPLHALAGGYDFARVIAAFHRGRAGDDPALRAAALRWLRAEQTSRTEARRELGVRTIIEDEALYDHLKLLTAFVRLAGCRGLLVCLDELAVISHRLNDRASRERNYEVILRILNDALQRSAPGFMLLLAATDECLSDPRRGLFSDEALATRLAGGLPGEEAADRSGPVLRLEPLDPADRLALARNVRQLFAADGAGRALLPDAAIEHYLASRDQRLGAAHHGTPREIVKEVTALLGARSGRSGGGWRELIDAMAAASANGQSGAPDSHDDDLMMFRL